MLTNIELFEKYRTIPYNVYNRTYKRFWKYREDLEQEGFLQLWHCVNRLDQTMSEGEQASYLYRAVGHCMHKYIFRKQYKHDHYQADIDLHSADGEQSRFAELYEAHRDILIDYTVIAALERALLSDSLAFKRYVHSMQIADIAAEEGLSLSNVNYKLKLFKNKIKGIIFRDGVSFDIEPEVYSVCETLRVGNKRDGVR